MFEHDNTHTILGLFLSVAIVIHIFVLLLAIGSLFV